MTLLLLPSLAPGQPATSDWPLFQGNVRHTGVSWFNGMDSKPDESNLRWRFSTSSLVYSFPVIGLDGTIFIADMGGEVYALDRGGNLKWSYSVGAGVRATPAISKNGHLIVANRDGFVYAFECTTGNVKWIFVTQGRTLSPPIIDSAGNVIFGSGDGYLYSVDDITGYFNWKNWTGPIGPVSPCIDSEGNIYIASRDKFLHSFNPDGSPRWSSDIPGDPRSPSIDENDIIYVSNKGGDITAFYSDGGIKWQNNTGRNIRATGALHPDGYYLLPTFEESLVMIDLEDGQYAGELQLQGDCEFPPVIADDGAIYQGTLGDFYAFTSDGHLMWQQDATTLMNVSPIMDAEGGFYEVGDGVLFAYGKLWPELEIIASDSIYARGDSIEMTVLLTADADDTTFYDLKAWYKPPMSPKLPIFDVKSKTQGLVQLELDLIHEFVDEGFVLGQYFVSVVLMESTTGYILDEDSMVIEIIDQDGNRNPIQKPRRKPTM